MSRSPARNTNTAFFCLGNKPYSFFCAYVTDMKMSLKVLALHKLNLILYGFRFGNRRTGKAVSNRIFNIEDGIIHKAFFFAMNSKNASVIEFFKSGINFSLVFFFNYTHVSGGMTCKHLKSYYFRKVFFIE